MTRRRILITGSSGRLGGTLVSQFAGDHDIVQLDVLEPPTAEQYALGTVFQGSIKDVSLFELAMEGVEVVRHCGSVPGALTPWH